LTSEWKGAILITVKEEIPTPMKTLKSMIPDRTDYNGWANYETWNVSMWLKDNYYHYRIAFKYVEHCRTFGNKISYDSLIPALEYHAGKITPDGVRWMNPIINTEELDRMLQEVFV